MPLPKNAPDDSLHRFNCCKTFKESPPRAWEFLFYIPNPLHPIEDDGDCSAHFCLVLPDSSKQRSVVHDPSYRAVALITRKPRSSTKQHGYIMFRPHTTCCTCPKRPRELETSVIDRVSNASSLGPEVIESPCHLYSRTDRKNKGHFETWSWYDHSVIPIQAPKMIHVECLHLMRPLTQPRFGLMLNHQSVLAFHKLFQCYKETSKRSIKDTEVGPRRLADRHKPTQAWSHVVRLGIPAA